MFSMFQSFFDGFFPRVFSVFREIATTYEPQISMGVAGFLLLSFFIKSDWRKALVGVAAVLASFKYYFLPDDMLSIFAVLAFYMCNFIIFFYVLEMRAMKKLEQMEEDDKQNRE